MTDRSLELALRSLAVSTARASVEQADMVPHREGCPDEMPRRTAALLLNILSGCFEEAANQIGEPPPIVQQSREG